MSTLYHKSKITCKKCHSENIGVFKAVHNGKNGTTFHQGYKCFNCHVVTYIERNKQFYDLTKNLPWSYKKHWNYGSPNIDDQIQSYPQSFDGKLAEYD